MSRSLLILRIGRWAGTEGMVIGALGGALFALVTTVQMLLSQVQPQRLAGLDYLVPGLILAFVLSVLSAIIGGVLGALLGLLFGGLSGMMLGVCSSRTRPILLVRWRVALVCLTTTLVLELVVLRLLGTALPPASLTIGSLSDLRRATFQLKSGVLLYGGFAGSETQLRQRN